MPYEDVDLPDEPAPAIATADDLVAGDLDMEGRPVPLPSGKTVRVRGLSRHELHFNGRGTEDPSVVERRNVVSCLVEPKLTLAQVEQWQRHSPAGGDFRVLTEAIRDLSAIGEGAAKSDPGTDRS